MTRNKSKDLACVLSAGMATVVGCSALQNKSYEPIGTRTLADGTTIEAGLLVTETPDGSNIQVEMTVGGTATGDTTYTTDLPSLSKDQSVALRSDADHGRAWIVLNPEGTPVMSVDYANGRAWKYGEHQPEWAKE